MSRKFKMYFILLISFALIPTIIYGGVIVKAILLMSAVALVLSKDAVYLPALIVLASYLTNSYPIYIGMMVLAIINFEKIKQHGAHKILLILLLLLPIIIYTLIIKYFFLDSSIGLALNQFQFYFTLFAFFYGILISESFDDEVIRALVFTMFVLYLINFLAIQFAGLITIRLVFFIIPFFFSYVLYLFKKRLRYSTAAFLFTLLTAFLIFSIRLTTFTIIFLILYSTLLAFLYFRGMYQLINRITGIWIIIIFFGFVGFSIALNYKEGIKSGKIINMEDVKSFNELSLRFQEKYLLDRGRLWTGAWKQIINDENWMPPVEIEKIFINYGGKKGIEFEHHSHNIYLELIRSNGILMGGILSLVLVSVILKGRKIFEIRGLNPFLIIFVSVSISGLLIGGTTGIYPLLASFAICGLSISGIAFGKYTILKCESAQKQHSL